MTAAGPVRGDESATAIPEHESIILTQELNPMLLHEVLTRARMHDEQCWASHARLARQLVAVRRWQWLARYADRRANRAAARL